MRRTMLKSKIHRARVTAASIDYEGSITIDRELMVAVDIIEYEQVHVLDITNGARLVTYAIAGEAGEICINGAAARRVSVGDAIIIIAYAEFTAPEMEVFKPRIVHVDSSNAITAISGGVAGDEIKQAGSGSPFISDRSGAS